MLFSKNVCCFFFITLHWRNRLLDRMAESVRVLGIPAVNSIYTIRMYCVLYIISKQNRRARKSIWNGRWGITKKGEFLYIGIYQTGSLPSTKTMKKLRVFCQKEIKKTYQLFRIDLNYFLFTLQKMFHGTGINVYKDILTVLYLYEVL